MEPLVETRLSNGMFKISTRDVEHPRDLTPPEKIAFDKKQTELHQRADLRQQECWAHDCNRAPHVWVVEVCFDFKGEKADPIKHAAITSADYDGPVPGFCKLHLGTGPRDLAETVYFARPEMYWGVRPTRWFVTFTDGSRQGDQILTIDPKQALPTIIEEFIPGG